MRYSAEIEGRKYAIDVDENTHIHHVTLDGRELTVDWQLVGERRSHLSQTDDPRADHYSILIGQRSYDAYARLTEGDDTSPEGGARTIEVLIGGRPYVVSVQDERSRALASLAAGAHVSGDAPIRAPMPGLVRSVLAEQGAEVQRGQTVVVLEAMKMENDLPSPRAGIVKSVRVEQGQTVNQGDILAIVGDPAGTEPAPSEEDE
ncbi:MAG: acetyl-CoA carboxylase biotin carboxyl carrier protein subunit [Ktedonobacterales bacterium]